MLADKWAELSAAASPWRVAYMRSIAEHAITQIKIVYPACKTLH